MPTDLGVASERKRKATQAETQTAIMILLVCVIITLAMLLLLFSDQSFSKATTELMGRLGPWPQRPNFFVARSSPPLLAMAQYVKRFLSLPWLGGALSTIGSSPLTATLIEATLCYKARLGSQDFLSQYIFYIVREEVEEFLTHNWLYQSAQRWRTIVTRADSGELFVEIITYQDRRDENNCNNCSNSICNYFSSILR
jgi:hypothetical protein